ncbi:MAG: hypothetical protein KDD94_07000, partial [Calditrichaeota bacterium]|nr:hypothetical protein [Calditrichota bacterium]
MNPDVQIDLYAVLNLLGVVQGLLLAYFFTNRNHRQIPSNLYTGLLLLSASILSFDSFLGYTNYMFRVIRLNDFSEPLAFLIGPYFYFYVYSKLTNQKPGKTIYHYLPAILYFIYMIPFHVADESIKYNAYINAYHPDLEFQKMGDGLNFTDFLGLHDHVNELIVLSLICYVFLAFRIYLQKRQSVDQKTQNFVRISLIFFSSIILLFFLVKLFFIHDLGDFIINSATAITIYSISIRLIGQSLGFKGSSEKYKKSALDQDYKDRLLKKITR